MQKIGIDIVEVKRIKLKNRIVELILHCAEIEIFKSKSNKRSQKEFLAGRWAAKEALIKTLSQPVAMNNINIAYQNQQPVFENKEFSNYLVSISHEKKYAIAVVIG
ncbi:holo-[acyl-carrier-protein] synthase [Spiroplasma sabaudiense Ar-1343]|uniref:Holo-[acyl-carrier-protein] synthase n=1 Tax=Spiroplasma sabaudiense Ar-1343 TaxID=1276257 RepID=W6AAA2_9MOLU|nr:4'-phosphopantetheinyl transferase superfamily protein [Spiroplasma sabaudiense]AHI53992.1 holo-[acyl-carrier-protein] synthase [Spiroplasma sabaudiense Ar-1343]